MITVTKEIVGARPTRITRKEYICDSCGIKCYPDSYDMTDRYFVSDKGGFCWECLKTEFGFDDWME